MVQLPSVFDATEEVDDPFKAVPESWQTASIVESAYKQNNNKDGHYLMLKFKIAGGEVGGKTIQTYLNLDNPSTVAKAIAKRDLQAICNALDIESCEDTDILHGQPMKIYLEVQPATAKYGEGNKITKYASIEEVVDEDDGLDSFNDDIPF